MIEWEIMDIPGFEVSLSFKWNIIELTDLENSKYQRFGQ